MKRKIIPYNAADEKLKQLANASCLISGNCSAVRDRVTARFIDNSYKNGCTSVLIIDFSENDVARHAKSEKRKNAE